MLDNFTNWQPLDQKAEWIKIMQVTSLSKWLWKNKVAKARKLWAKEKKD